MKNVTIEFLETIEKMIKDRLTLVKIAEQLNLCKSTMSRLSKDGGGYVNFNAQVCFETYKKRRAEKKNNLSKYHERIDYSETLIYQIKELLDHGYTQRDIAGILKISKSTVQRLIRSGGGNNYFSPEKCIKVIEERSLSNSMKVLDVSKTLNERIDILEMQMQIIFETINKTKE